MKLRPVVATAPLLLALASCSSTSGGADSSADADASVDAPAAGGATSDLAVGSAPLTGAADSVALDYQAKSDDASTTTPAIVSTGSVTLSADDVRAAHDRVLRVVRGLDGTVDQDTMDTDTAGAVTTSHLVVRVPSASFDEALDDLAATADLRSSSSDKRDVTTQVIDTGVRLRVQRASIRRITQLLDRAGGLRDVIRIESELSRRQAALQSLLRRQAYLADQTSMASIEVGIDRTDVVPDDTERDGFLGGLHRGGDAFTGAASATATGLGASVPFAALALFVAALATPFVRRRRSGRGPDQDAVTG